MEMTDLYQLGRRLAEIALSDMGADELGITPAQFLVLQDLFLNGRSAVGDIAKRTGLAQSRVSTSVRDFAGRGWATTTDDPEDGRKTLVELTDDVEADGMKRRASSADHTLAAALGGIGRKERDMLIASLGRLHQILVADHPHRRFPGPADPYTPQRTVNGT
jgi:MarR family 2-MHQ and catechol resistance regulon transcriptional repressor